MKNALIHESTPKQNSNKCRKTKSEICQNDPANSSIQVHQEKKHKHGSTPRVFNHGKSGDKGKIACVDYRFFASETGAVAAAESAVLILTCSQGHRILRAHNNKRRCVYTIVL